MAKTIQAVRGMNDILPDESPIWQRVENILRQTFANYGYQEIRFPIVEKTELFKRTIGETTDIVEKEMYTFDDRNAESLTLRPEGTAVCVRAGIEHGLLHNQIQKLWYLGPFYRHERPQKGRYRQFFQCGAEVFGLAGPDIDVEIILVAKRILYQLGLLPHVELQINSLGSAESRTKHREKLIRYFESHSDELDDDSKNRLHKNPLRILDSKNPDLKNLIQNAPRLHEEFDAASRDHFTKLCELLRALNIKFTINPYLVRGLDYYNLTVFEWITTALGAQGTVCAGGRYDGLVEQLGGKATPAVGFALGMERVILLLQSLNPQPDATAMDVYLALIGEQAEIQGLKLAERLRDGIPNLRLAVNCGGGNIKSQLKKADKSRARILMLLGDEEIQQKNITLKFLREDKPQQTVMLNQLKEFLQKNL